MSTQQDTGKGIAWLTGASTGIGHATALRMAYEGWTVVATARSEDRLGIMEKEGADLRGKIIAMPGDVTKIKDMAKIVKTIESDIGPIDLALFNAGAYFKDGLEDFSARTYKEQFDVNVFGVANCLEPVLEVFRERGKGHIAIVASIAGYRGLPRALSYGSSKSALINLAEGLAIECQKTDIKVQVICPGFVKTPMTALNDFYMPMLMDVDVAAGKLVEGLKSNRFEIVFPWLFATYVKLAGKILPARLYFRLLHHMNSKQQSADNPPPQKTQEKKDGGELKKAA